MELREAWKLTTGDWVRLKDGRYGCFQYFAAKGIRKPYVHSARRAQSTEFMFLDPLGFVPIVDVEGKLNAPLYH